MSGRVVRFHGGPLHGTTFEVTAEAFSRGVVRVAQPTRLPARIEETDGEAVEPAAIRTLLYTRVSRMPSDFEFAGLG